MSSKHPRLRGKAQAPKSLYPLGEFPDDVVIGIGKQIVHRLAIGQANIDGEDFGGIFATAISGEHRSKPLGVTDVTWNDTCSWSLKTVQSKYPFRAKTVRLISGRNSPVYSSEIADPFDDIAATGAAVLGIWNERVNRSKRDYDDLRVVVLIRDIAKLEFTLFECEAVRYPPADYEWRLNKERNFQGYEKTSGKHFFTWQPHGSQFTILKDVPGSAYKFRIVKNVQQIDPNQVLMLVGFKDEWIQRVYEND